MTQDQAPQRELYFTPLTPSEREALGSMMGCSEDLVEKWICEHKGALVTIRGTPPWVVSNQLLSAAGTLGKVHPWETWVSCGVISGLLVAIDDTKALSIATQSSSCPMQHLFPLSFTGLDLLCN